MSRLHCCFVLLKGTMGCWQRCIACCPCACITCMHLFHAQGLAASRCSRTGLPVKRHRAMHLLPSLRRASGARVGSTLLPSCSLCCSFMAQLGRTSTQITVSLPRVSPLPAVSPCLHPHKPQQDSLLFGNGGQSCPTVLGKALHANCKPVFACLCAPHAQTTVGPCRVPTTPPGKRSTTCMWKMLSGPVVAAVPLTCCFTATAYWRPGAAQGWGSPNPCLRACQLCLPSSTGGTTPMSLHKQVRICAGPALLRDGGVP